MTILVGDDRTHKVSSAYMHVLCSYRKAGCPFIIKLTKAKEGGWLIRGGEGASLFIDNSLLALWLGRLTPRPSCSQLTPSSARRTAAATRRGPSPTSRSASRSTSGCARSTPARRRTRTAGAPRRPSRGLSSRSPTALRKKSRAPAGRPARRPGPRRAAASPHPLLRRARRRQAAPSARP